MLRPLSTLVLFYALAVYLRRFCFSISRRCLLFTLIFMRTLSLNLLKCFRTDSAEHLLKFKQFLLEMTLLNDTECYLLNQI